MLKAGIRVVGFLWLYKRQINLHRNSTTFGSRSHLHFLQCKPTPAGDSRDFRQQSSHQLATQRSVHWEITATLSSRAGGCLERMRTELLLPQKASGNNQSRLNKCLESATINR